METICKPDSGGKFRRNCAERRLHKLHVQAQASCVSTYLTLIAPLLCYLSKPLLVATFITFTRLHRVSTFTCSFIFLLFIFHFFIHSFEFLKQKTLQIPTQRESVCVFFLNYLKFSPKQPISKDLSLQKSKALNFSVGIVKYCNKKWT